MSSQADPISALRGRLEFPVSPVRLNRYQSASRDDVDLLANYFWNIALCETLYPSLGAVEVSLRNSIHTAATIVYGSEYWFDEPGVLIRNHPNAIRVARAALTRYQRPHTPGRIVAELNFGFWSGILTGPYEQHFWRSNSYVMLKMAFPHISYKIRTRKRIHRQYNAIRLLRNRVFHYEPIFDRPALEMEHEDILNSISWVSPSLKSSIELIDRFSDEFQYGRERIRQRLQALR